MDTKVFTLDAPQLTVAGVEKDDLPGLRDLIHSHPGFFPQFGDSECLKVKVHGNSLIIPGGNPFDDQVIARPGFSLVASDNGKRFLTDDPKVKHGIFVDVPWELLVPGYGTPVNNS